MIIGSAEYLFAIGDVSGSGSEWESQWESESGSEAGKMQLLQRQLSITFITLIYGYFLGWRGPGPKNRVVWLLCSAVLLSLLHLLFILLVFFFVSSFLAERKLSANVIDIFFDGQVDKRCL